MDAGLDRRAVDLLRVTHPEVIAVYRYGSSVQGTMHAESDIDIALLGAAPLARSRASEASFALQKVYGRDVDVIDLRTATPVLRAQVLGSSIVLDSTNDSLRAAFEAYALADYARLNEERRAILEDILAEAVSDAR